MLDVFQIWLKVRTNRPIYPTLGFQTQFYYLYLLPYPLRAINMPSIPPQKYFLTRLNKIVYAVSFFLPTAVSIRYVS